MKKIMFGLLLLSSTGAFAENLSQVIPGVWDSTSTVAIDPRNGDGASSSPELRMIRNTGRIFTATALDCSSAEFSQLVSPIMQDAYDRNVKVNIKMDMRIEFSATTSIISVVANGIYSAEGNSSEANCSLKSDSEMRIDDENSQMIEVATGEKTTVRIIGHDEVIVN